ncbi:hypothetical protein HK098_002951 [Nowakowskiella sp. JEL0407]|nr:hypothetical protein HK098_002951 [Nowakowskiella sp. JEL0407]
MKTKRCDFSVAELLQKSPVFKEIPRISSTSTSLPDISSFVNECFTAGIPCIISDVHKSWFSPLSKTFDALSESTEPAFICDLSTKEETSIELRKVFKTVKTKVDDSDRVFYGKDITCPAELKALVEQHLTFDSFTKNCVMDNLPPEIHPQHWMLYVGAEGSYTPGHVDLCNSIGNNIIIHTEDDTASAMWFMFNSKDIEQVDTFWRKSFKDEHRGELMGSVGCLFEDSFWCDPERFLELEPSGVNVWITEQKLGDYIIVPPSCAHQVYNKGSVNVKVAWNNLNLNDLPVSYNKMLPAYRKSFKREIYKIKSVIYYSVKDLTKKLSESLSTNERSPEINSLARNLDTLIPLLKSIVQSETISYSAQELFPFPELSSPESRAPTKYDDDSPHARACDFCNCDIFNFGVIVRFSDDEEYDICVDCFAMGRGVKLERGRKLELRYFLEDEELTKTERKAKEILEACCALGYQKMVRMVEEIKTNEINAVTLTYMKLNLLLMKNEETFNCHNCRISRGIVEMIECRNVTDELICGTKWCERCLWNRYKRDISTYLMNPSTFKCPVCDKICNCKNCVMGKARTPPKSSAPELRYCLNVVGNLVYTGKNFTPKFLEEMSNEVTTTRDTESVTAADNPTPKTSVNQAFASDSQDLSTRDESTAFYFTESVYLTPTHYNLGLAVTDFRVRGFEYKDLKRSATKAEVMSWGSFHGTRRKTVDRYPPVNKKPRVKGEITF